MRKVISLLLVLTMLAAAAAVSFTSVTATNPDPAETYVEQIAPNEDASLKMWFDHSTNKVHMEDHKDTGLDTYSIYLAKNEMQGAHIILYAPTETKSNLSVSYSQFTAMDGSGATVETAFFYEFYVDVQKVARQDILGFTAENSIIRNGVTPEAIAPVESLNKGLGTFSIQQGMSQALYVRLKTTAETQSGWYSGTFDIKNEAGEVIKTATVFAYVWDFELPQENHLQTGIYLSYQTAAPSVYEMQYNYLLENRLQGMDLPGTLNSSNPYLDDPRVTAFRIAKKGTYLGTMTAAEIKAVYDDLKTRDDWAELEAKTYFYTVDEPTSQQQIDYIQAIVPTYYRPTIDTCISESTRINSAWPNANTLVVMCDNFPYPDNYSKTLALNSNGTYATKDDGSGRFSDVSDAIQAAMNYDVAKIWCPKMCMFTPHSVIESTGYHGNNEFACGVRNMNGVVSGFDCGNANALYFDWDSIYGSFQSRFFKYQADEALEGNDVRLWWYACGKNADYTYCYHNIENLGLQTELMFWQTMQEKSTGYLYYGANLYSDERGNTLASNVVDTDYVVSSTSEGTLVPGKWLCNLGVRDGYCLYGNGVLFYDRTLISALKLKGVNVLGTIRVEEMRDGIEDYEMLYMYRELFGEKAMQNYISRVSDNVVSYLTMPTFDRSEWDASMTNEDIFAQVRIKLGNILEAAMAECPHEWDEGVITTEPTYTETGIITYTCTLCGETYTDTVPVLDPLPGDVDGDGFIGTKDSKLISKYLLGTVDDSAIVMVNADIDGDEFISTKDTKALKKLLLTE